MKNNKRRGDKSYSWPMIIALIVLFFPVGFYLMYKRLLAEGKSSLLMYKYGSYFCLFIAISSIMVMIGDGISGDNISIMILFGVGGVLLFNKYNKDKGKEVRYKRYNAIIKNETNISNISRVVEAPIDIVRSEINDMITEGSIKDAYIDYNTDRVILNGEKSKSNENKEEKSVQCQSCGAKNNIDSNNRKCEYCGTIL